MGVTIHYRLGQDKKYVPKMLDETCEAAQLLKTMIADKVGVSMGVVRDHPYRMRVEIGNCEWLQFGFGGMAHWKPTLEGRGWSYEDSTLRDIFTPAILEDDRMMWCSAFCKTQYAKSLVEHKLVADILHFVASRCEYVSVYDEGEYYHSGEIKDAANAIGANGKMIEDLGKQLRDNFGDDNIFPGGITHIKP